MQPRDLTARHAPLVDLLVGGPDETGSDADHPRHSRRGSTVHLLAAPLLDDRGQRTIHGGRQRWQLALARLLQSRGHDVVIHQRAEHAFRARLSPGVAVRAHAAARGRIGAAALNRAAHREIPTDAPVVYLSEELTLPSCRPRSVLVQHGVRWDRDAGWLDARLAEWTAHRAVARCAAVICVDTNFINWYRTRWPGDRAADDKLHFVPNFVDPDLFGPQPARPAAATAPGDPIVVCIPRRVHPDRGPWLITDVAPRLAERFPGARFRFVVGSEGDPESLRQRLAVSGIGLPRWQIEALPFERMREAYERSAIVALPTVSGAGSSFAAIEAMYFGCAVVATWVGGLPDLIRDRHNGVLVPPVADRLEGALARLIGDADLRAALGRRAMAEAVELYGIDRWRRGVGAVLERALGVTTA